MDERLYRYVDGVYLCNSFHEKNVRSGMAYQPEDGDVFIACYPKCGTTWMQHITYHIFNSNAPMRNAMEMMLKFSPFLEMLGAESAKNMTRPGAIKTHLTYDKTPISEKAKYIVVPRNPYDCCVSYYYHTKNFPHYQFQDGTFDDFVDAFVRGKVEFGDYFDHLFSWYNHRNDPNVFFVTYEEIKKDTRAWILKLAEFLGEEYARKLRDHPDLLEDVLQKSNIKTMKEFNKNVKKISEVVQAHPDLAASEGFRLLKESIVEGTDDTQKGEFVRKGVVGDWRNHFTKDQVAKMKEWIAIKTKGSDVMNLWKDVDIP